MATLYSPLGSEIANDSSAFVSLFIKIIFASSKGLFKLSVTLPSIFN